MQKYTLMPGKMIQTCRRVVESIHEKSVPLASARLAQELLNKLNEQSIIEADRSGGVLVLYDYLKACLNYYFAYDQSIGPMNSITLIPTASSNKLAEFDEALEISKEILRNSCKNITPPRSKFRINSEAKNLVTQNSIFSKSESTKSIQPRDSYESALEERFREFLRPKRSENFGSISSRIHLIDEFEREIRDEIREKFLHKIVDENTFEEEVRKARFE